MVIVPVHNIQTNDIQLYLRALREIMRDNDAIDNEIRVFDFEHVRYVFNNRTEQFVRLRQFDEMSTTNQLIHPDPPGVNVKERLIL